ncbi:hypothetical protein [Candidatus Methylobacter favarea]|uniref:hypothetical protein n=1 Tax=Candidatus Methylobacter favarea TaxID=2707345 RepID=UPI00157E07CD|nr:hypothetical protein [Candidatus Methylobacter favarea]
MNSSRKARDSRDSSYQTASYGFAVNKRWIYGIAIFSSPIKIIPDTQRFSSFLLKIRNFTILM